MIFIVDAIYIRVFPGFFQLTNLVSLVFELNDERSWKELYYRIKMHRRFEESRFLIVLMKKKKRIKRTFFD